MCPRVGGKGQQVGSRSSGGLLMTDVLVHIAEHTCWQQRFQINSSATVPGQILIKVRVFTHPSSTPSSPGHTTGVSHPGQTKPALWHTPALTPLPVYNKHLLPILPGGGRTGMQTGDPGDFLPEECLLTNDLLLQLLGFFQALLRGPI